MPASETIPVPVIDVGPIPRARTQTARYGVPRAPLRDPLPDPDLLDQSSVALLAFVMRCLKHLDHRAQLRDSDDHVLILLHKLEAHVRRIAVLEGSTRTLRHRLERAQQDIDLLRYLYDPGKALDNGMGGRAFSAEPELLP